MTTKLQILYEEYKDCQKCPALCATRTNVVFGIGNSNADILVVAEAPGANEDKAGVPLIGASGKLLDWFLCKVSGDQRLLTLAEDFKKVKKHFNGVMDYVWETHRNAKEILCERVFYTNAIMCWPGKGNRDPSHEELKNCNDRLMKTIYYVDPKIIIGVGKPAIQALTGKAAGSILKNKGQIFEIEVPGELTTVKYPVMPVLHPSFLMRQPQEEYWRETMEDLRRAMELINETN